MNKGIIFAGVTVFILVGGGLFVANQQSQKAEQEKMMQKKSATKTNADAEMEEKKVMENKKDAKKMTDITNTPRYGEFSMAAYDQTASKRRVLYFYATWCPSCKIANSDFTANPSKIPEDVIVLRVNYNDPDTDQDEKGLAKKYGITYQHTFVQVDNTGKEMSKWNGGQTDELLTNAK
ncbi:MAG: thioredoxin family protein [Patescibacteria group bacterium]